MITYFILHRNRPYFLEANVNAIRKYFPEDTYIVVLDDGSYDFIRDKIVELPIDDFVGIDQWNEKSCCRLLHRAINSKINSEFVMFSEDDFLFCPSMIEVKKENAKGEFLFDPVYEFYVGLYNNASRIIEDSMELLRRREDIRMLQLSRPVKDNVFYTEKVLATRACNWKILAHRKMPHYYYTNWPYMMRTEDFRSIKCPTEGRIEDFEITVSSWLNKSFGSGDWAMCPERPYYFHIGYAFSLQSEMNERRQSARQDLLRLIGVKNDVSWEKVIKKLCMLWAESKFHLDLSPNCDLQGNMIYSFIHLKGKI